MSEFKVEVVTVGPVEPHPNADRLELTKVFDYPVVVKKGDLREGDLAVYIPIDAVIPFTEPWTYVHEGHDDARHRRVRAKRLRGIFSQGILVHVNDDSLPPGVWYQVGEDVAAKLGIMKYEPPTPKFYRTGQVLSNEPKMPQYTDIQHIQRYSRNLEDGEPVVITEKIHGSNARFGWINKDGALVWLVGSRQVIKAKEWEYGWRTPWKWLEAKVKSWVFKQTKKHYYTTDVWSAAAKKYGLKQKLRQYPGLIFYGEVYGDGIQDLKYGLVGEQRVAFFDVYDTVEGKYLDYYTSDLLFDTLGLPKAPLLYRGGWDHDMCYLLMTGLSHVEPCQIREGLVVRPTVDRVSHSGRVIYKGINPDYLLRQGGTEFH